VFSSTAYIGRARYPDPKNRLPHEDRCSWVLRQCGSLGGVGFANRYDLGRFLRALRAAHPWRELLWRHFLADQAWETSGRHLSASATRITRTKKSPKRLLM